MLDTFSGMGVGMGGGVTQASFSWEKCKPDCFPGRKICAEESRCCNNDNTVHVRVDKKYVAEYCFAGL